MGKEEKYVVVLWEHGWHCDEFDIIEARGPFSREEACRVEENLMRGEYSTEIVPIKAEKENGKEKSSNLANTNNP